MNYKDILGMTIILYGFWLLISWNLDWANLFLGLVFSFFVALFMAPDLIRKEERPPFLARGFYFIRFLVVLIIQIIKANVQVVQIVLSPRLKILPQFIEVDQPMHYPVTQVMWGNCITLTPGTLSVDVDENKLLIHFLSEEMITDFGKNPVRKVLKDFEGRSE